MPIDNIMIMVCHLMCMVEHMAHRGCILRWFSHVLMLREDLKDSCWIMRFRQAGW